MAIEKEVVFEFNKMVRDHIHILWTVGGGLVALDILMLAHIVKLRKLPTRKWIIYSFLVLSIGFGAFSLIAGYISEGLLISSMEDFASGQEWVPSGSAEDFVLLQMIGVVGGIILFVAVFCFYAHVLANILIRIGGITHIAGGDDAD